MSNDSQEDLLGTIDLSAPQVTYANFGSRLGGTIIDGLIISVLVLPLSYFNIIEWKSPVLYVIVSILSMAYKPTLEYLYGATIGKKAVKIKVVNYSFGRADLTAILLRNSIALIIAIISIVLTVSMFSMPGFQEVRGYMDYIKFMAIARQGSGFQWISWTYYVVDLIIFFTDKSNRTLHDRIGSTYVINVVE